MLVFDIPVEFQWIRVHECNQSVSLKCSEIALRIGVFDFIVAFALVPTITANRF